MTGLLVAAGAAAALAVLLIALRARGSGAHRAPRAGRHASPARSAVPVRTGPATQATAVLPILGEGRPRR